MQFGLTKGKKDNGSNIHSQAHGGRASWKKKKALLCIRLPRKGLLQGAQTPAYFLQELFAYVKVFGILLSYWSLCWHCGCSGSFWFEICSSRWSYCAGTQDRVGFKVFFCALVWNVGINCQLDSEICRLVLRLLLETWKHTCSELVFLIRHSLFWVCITFCRVLHNVRLIIIIIMMICSS